MLYEMSEKSGQDLVELYPNSKVFFVKRGAIISIFDKKHLFLGGAESTDKMHRTEGQTWWKGEQPSKEEFDLFFHRFDTEKPEVIITHDAPLRVNIFRVGRESSYTPNMLERVYQLSTHKPKYHFYGHHHIVDTQSINHTNFMCCGLHGEKWIWDIGFDSLKKIEK